MSKARTKYKQLCQQERWNWQSRIQSEERTNERHEMSDEKYKRTARNERREVQWHRRPRSTFRAVLYLSQARMRTNHHLHQINSKHHLPGNKCNPRERERERERTPEGSIETTDKWLKVVTSIMVSPGVGGTVTVQGAFSAPLVVLSFGSSWSGQSVSIVQQECTDHELILPHLSLISPLPYMSLCFTPCCE